MNRFATIPTPSNRTWGKRVGKGTKGVWAQLFAGMALLGQRKISQTDPAESCSNISVDISYFLGRIFPHIMIPVAVFVAQSDP